MVKRHVPNSGTIDREKKEEDMRTFAMIGIICLFAGCGAVQQQAETSVASAGQAEESTSWTCVQGLRFTHDGSWQLLTTETDVVSADGESFPTSFLARGCDREIATSHLTRKNCQEWIQITVAPDEPPSYLISSVYYNDQDRFGTVTDLNLPVGTPSAASFNFSREGRTGMAWGLQVIPNRLETRLMAIGEWVHDQNAQISAMRFSELVRSATPSTSCP
jgi:hypothetical protein